MRKKDAVEEKMEVLSFDPSRDRIDPNMKSHLNDPFFLEKATRGAETLKRVGFPKEFLDMRAQQDLKASK